MRLKKYKNETFNYGLYIDIILLLYFFSKIIDIYKIDYDLF